MKKINPYLMLSLLITLSVSCNKKEESDDIVSNAGTVRTLSELASNGTTACMTTGLNKIGSLVSNTPHSWKQSYQLGADGSFQFDTTIYKDGSCSSDVYSVSQIGTIEVKGASAKVTNGTNATITLTMTMYSPSDSVYQTAINTACTTNVIVDGVASFGGRGCQYGSIFTLINFQNDGGNFKNTFVYDANASTMKIHRDTSSHIGFYSFGSSSYPTSTGLTFNTY